MVSNIFPNFYLFKVDSETYIHSLNIQKEFQMSTAKRQNIDGYFFLLSRCSLASFGQVFSGYWQTSHGQSLLCRSSVQVRFSIFFHIIVHTGCLIFNCFYLNSLWKLNLYEGSTRVASDILDQQNPDSIPRSGINATPLNKNCMLSNMMIKLKERYFCVSLFVGMQDGYKSQSLDKFFI